MKKQVSPTLSIVLLIAVLAVVVAFWMRASEVKRIPRGEPPPGVTRGPARRPPGTEGRGPGWRGREGAPGTEGRNQPGGSGPTGGEEASESDREKGK
jgi:hypothetical protein